MGFMMKPTEERPMAPARRLPCGERRGRADDADADEGAVAVDGADGGEGVDWDVDRGYGAEDDKG
jgi:hypothetical protein